MTQVLWLAGMLAANLWGIGDTPVPAQPWVADRVQERLDPKDPRVPILPPIKPGERPLCEDAPDQAEILRALPRVTRGVPYLFEEFRDDIEFTVEKLVDRIDPPRFFPLIGPAQLHHCHWKCTVYFTETIEATTPFPFRIQKRRAEIVYIDKDHLHLCVSGADAQREMFKEMTQCPAGGAAVSRAPRKVASPDIITINTERLIPKGPYRLEPLEVLIVNVKKKDQAPDTVCGRHVIAPDGSLYLGRAFGKVRVAGLTLEEARDAVCSHVTRAGNTPCNVDLTIENMRGVANIRGEHLVRPDGTISLGVYGSVHIGGMTLDQAKAAIEKHLGEYLVEPRVSVDVQAYKSRNVDPAVVQAAQVESPKPLPPLQVDRKRAMTIDDVVKMSRKGIAADIITRQMELTNAVFNLTVDDIIRLHDEGVAVDIIRAMQERHEENMKSSFSGDPIIRMEQLMIDSENLRQMHDEWRRFWMNDQPSHLTPYRIHGGVGPASSTIRP